MGRVPTGLHLHSDISFLQVQGISQSSFLEEFLHLFVLPEKYLRGCSELREEKRKRVEVSTSSWSCPHPRGAGGRKAGCPSSPAPGCVFCAEAAVDVIHSVRRTSNVAKPGSFISSCRPPHFRGRRSESFSS